MTSVLVSVPGRWKVIHEKGPFSRSGGLQVGVDYVTVSISECKILFR